MVACIYFEASVVVFRRRPVGCEVIDAIAYNRAAFGLEEFVFSLAVGGGGYKPRSAVTATTIQKCGLTFHLVLFFKEILPSKSYSG